MHSCVTTLPKVGEDLVAFFVGETETMFTSFGTGLLFATRASLSLRLADVLPLPLFIHLLRVVGFSTQFFGLVHVPYPA